MIAVMGDFHIPDRARSIPEWAMERAREAELVLCTGDLTEYATLYALENASKVVAVRGNMDTFELPEREVVGFDDVRILLVHGHQVRPRGDPDGLAALAKMEGVDVVVHGHTHRADVREHRGVLLVNPGTVTGAWGGGHPLNPKTMVEMEIRDVITVRVVRDGKTVSVHEYHAP